MYEIERSYHVIFSKVVKRVHKSKWYRDHFRFGANESKIFLFANGNLNLEVPQLLWFAVPSLEYYTARRGVGI